MGRIKRIDMENNGITLLLEISPDEYKMLKSSRDLILVPKEDSFLSEKLTSGKLGHGNRIMVPNKLLNRHDVKLMKKLPACIFETDGEKYFLIKLKGSPLIPEFEE